MNSQVRHFPHFYIYDTGKHASDHQYKYGDYDFQNDKIIKQRETDIEKTFLSSVTDTIKSLRADKAGVIIYIHGFQGDNKFFVQSSGFIIQRNVFDHPEHRYGMGISLQWKSSLAYQDAVLTALEKGAQMAPIIDSLYRIIRQYHHHAPVSILCHSMGNRVWQGLYEQWININQEFYLENVLMFAPDLEADIFETNFESIEKHCGQIHIYHNLTDRTLQMANAMKEHKRLGIYGPMVDSNKPPFSNELLIKMKIRNVTDIKDEETFAGKLSLHRYYYGSPSIRKEIVEILSGKF
ncbi:MAG: alpha/beta hydrolase [Saprospiraceae bacterium]|nr:alpha/beta hydrolase [Saprospiraceae bacterium]